LGSEPLDFHLFWEKTKTGKEKPEDDLMTKVFKFLSIYTISIVSVLSALFLVALSGLPAAAQQIPQVLSNAVANAPIQFDVSRPLAQLLREAPAQQQGDRVTHAPMQPKLQQLKGAQLSQGGVAASALQPLIAPLSAISATIGLSFEGVSVFDCRSIVGFRVAPPDTNAAVGDTQVVQWVNVCYAVYDKSTGGIIAGPFAGNAFWKGFGGPCETSNDGDIIIQWDKSNHRWLASQNVFSPPYMTCIAVSQTADATGSYFRYAFPQPGFPDYPKWGLTRSVYYQTQNDFGADDGFQGVNVCAYNAHLMLKGSSKATQVCILDNSFGTLFDDSMLPADDDSDSDPIRREVALGSDDSESAPTRPEVLLGSIDNFLPGDTHVYEYVFKVDFKHPANSTLAGINGSMPISVPAFKLAICPSGAFLTTNCVPQPGTTARLDTLGDRLMYRLAHFDERGKQHFLVTHSVNNTTAVAARWYEFRAHEEDSTRLTLHQSGQTPDDGHYRWMGSVAMDRMGNTAIGYSRSSATPGDYPSIYYAGQRAGDPLGTTETEALIKQGSGSQTDTADRWGDYSSMALDGSDSCTFWYTTEYYPATGSFRWATWLASLKFPNCGREEREE
jgi:hypothetical protein